MRADPRRRELLIRTPEGVAFSFELGGPVIRGIAFVVDLLIISVITNVLGGILAVLSLISSDLFGAIATLLFFAVQLGYGILLEWKLRGQTLGKRILRLRVMDAQGLKLTFSQIVLRNILRPVDSLPIFYLLGGATSFLHPLAQRLGDIAAGTVVIRETRHREPDLAQIETPKYNTLREHPHLAARLRQNIPPRDAALALNALLRRNDLEPQARAKLFDDLAAHLTAATQLPEGLLAGLTPEQTVRNIVDVLYRTDR